jgi:hypothetical protein
LLSQRIERACKSAQAECVHDGRCVHERDNGRAPR